MPYAELLHVTTELAASYLDRAASRHVGGRSSRDELIAASGGPLPEHGSRPVALARRMAGRLSAVPDIAILNDVVLNQVLVRFGDHDETTRRVIARVQADGTCWAGGAIWHG